MGLDSGIGQHMIPIAGRGVSAVKWSAASTVAIFGLQMVTQIFLARRLGPDIYGIFGIGLVVFGFSNFLATFGFGWALQQLIDLREDDVRFAFSWQLASGVAAGLGVFLLAPWLATYFHDLRVEPVIRWLSLACVLEAVASPASNLLARELNFRARGMIDVAGYGLGYVGVGIPLAIAGAGVYALVAAWLVQSTVKLVGSYGLSRHSVRLLFWYERASIMFGVGGTVFVTNLSNWFLANLDRLLIGRLLNAAAVGLYNVGYNLANRPNSLLVGALQPAFFSATARLQEEPHRLRKAYLQVVATVWVLVAPVFVFLSVISTDLVRVLYGPRWIGAGGVLTVLFLAMPFYVTWAVSTPVLWNTGRRQYEMLLQLPLLAMAVPAFYAFAPMGVHAAAMTAAGLLAARSLVVGTAAFRAARLHLSDLLPHLSRGALLSMLAAGGALIGGRISSGFAADSPFGARMISLVAASVTATALVVGVVCIWPTLLGSHAGTMVARFAPKLTSFLRVPVAVPVVSSTGGGRG